MKRNIVVFKLLLAQVGWWRAIKFTISKAAKKFLTPHRNHHYSQTGEDLILEHLASIYLKRDVFSYLDIGCHDARKISTSYFHYLKGCSGLAIDVNGNFSVSFLRERPNDVFICAALSDKSEEVELHEFAASEVNTINNEQALQWEKKWTECGRRVVQAVPLGELLYRQSLGRQFDVLMMDVEGHELQVLRGADLDSLAPKIIICEIHDLDIYELDKNPVVSYLHAHRYRLVSYATMNAYFVRADIFEHKVGQQQTSQSGNSA